MLIPTPVGITTETLPKTSLCEWPHFIFILFEVDTTFKNNYDEEFF